MEGGGQTGEGQGGGDERGFRGAGGGPYLIPIRAIGDLMRWWTGVLVNNMMLQYNNRHRILCVTRNLVKKGSIFRQRR